VPALVLHVVEYKQ